MPGDGTDRMRCSEQVTEWVVRVIMNHLNLIFHS